jgi:hypothetical protein
MFKDYRNSMKENWQSYFAGIMIPVYGVVMIMSKLLITNNTLGLIVEGIVSLLFIISIGLVVRQRIKKDNVELEKCRNSFVSRYGEEPKTFKQMRNK